MPYATRAALRLDERTLAQLTGVAPDAPPVEATIAAALAAADRLIDTQLRQRYPLPLSDPDGVLVELSAALARYALYEQCPGMIEVPKPVVDARTHAWDLLKDLRDGRASLGQGDTGPAAADGARTVVRTRARTLSDALMERY